MNTVTANALLKTLEEPAGDTRFVLASESAHQLLPTIRSRCQTHAMEWPAEEEALIWLEQQARESGLKEVGREQAGAWLRAAGGRTDDALQVAVSGLSAARWASLPQALARGDWSMVSDWSAAQQLSLLQKLCHDLMAVAAGARPRFFAADSLPPAPRWLVLARWSKALMEAARSVEHPYNAGLMQEAWVASTRQVFARTAARP
jgi:DNA polymerase III subunit delta'